MRKHFKIPTGTNHTVDDVSFTIEEGETLGVIGELGCSKNTLGGTLIRLQDVADGQILLDGRDVTKVKDNELEEVREKMQIVFQDLYFSLNPGIRIESTVMGPLKHSGLYKTRNELRRQTKRLMDLAGTDERLGQPYPHELDGDRRQRVGVVRALALNPEFIVCDEPISALGVPVQAQILSLLMDSQDRAGIVCMSAMHDLSIVRYASNSICVMYLGQMVEKASTEGSFKCTLHPYTKALLSTIPSTDICQPIQRVELKEEIASPINPKSGCCFALRYPYATEACSQPQKLEEIEPHYFVACYRVRELN